MSVCFVWGRRHGRWAAALAAAARALGAIWGLALACLLLLLLSACASAPPPVVSQSALEPKTSPGSGTMPPHPRSRWVPVEWSELPGLEQDALFEAWNAWLKSCEKPPPAFAALCQQIRLLSLADGKTQLAWLQTQFRPYRIESLSGSSDGLLTGYFEPTFVARRWPGHGFEVPLYRAPAGLSSQGSWFTRQQAQTSAAAQAQLQGHELLYLADPVDAMLLQIQGSGRLLVTEADGREHLVRLAFAGTNNQPYRSIGRWLLDRGYVQDASWPGIRAWLKRHPERQNELLWQNPRLVFFKEEELSAFDAAFGPRGAQGVPLTPERSIAVDPQSIPLGAPVWIASSGPLLNLARLVLAQDTGSAITGAVRADYFTGWSDTAGTVASSLKQKLNMWLLWPR